MKTETEAEYQSDAGSPEDTPYLVLTGELGGAFFVNISEKNYRVTAAPHCTVYPSSNGSDDVIHNGRRDLTKSRGT